MQYNVAELLKGSVGGVRHYAIDEKPEFSLEGARLVGPLSGKVHLMRTQDGVLAEVEVRVDIEAECSRCLRPVITEICAGFSDEYRPTVDIRTGFRIWPQPDDETDEELVIGVDQVLELDDAVRQELEAALPVQLLCDVDCAGLCQQCGKDLNEGPCQCQPEPDDRWSCLRDLFAQGATD